MKKFIRVLLEVILYIGILVGFVYAARNGLFGYRVVRVISNSMQPIIQKGDFILCKDVKSPDDIVIGEIYCYERGDKTILHRLVDITEDGYYIFKGDNNLSNDNVYVTIDNIVYREIKVLFNFDLLVDWIGGLFNDSKGDVYTR